MTVRVEKQAEPIPGYKLIERLGGGGFGEVWKAEAPGGLHKAIKFVFGDLQAAGNDGHRAEQELKALSRVKTVRHPYILSLERYDIIDGQLMIVMELADRNLWDRFKECRIQGLPGIPREELLGYMSEAAEALDLMNIEYQLQHLDIKPQNLFLVYQHVKVADFGLVKDLEGMQASVTGGVTPVYAAPETFDGWVSRFSDQYSLAIVYQELLTGQRPFSGTNVRQLVLQHLQTAPNLSPLPAADQRVIARSLSKKPDDRFPTCREMVQALVAASAGSAPAPAENDLGPEEADGGPGPGTPAKSSDNTGERIRAAKTAPAVSFRPVRNYSQQATPRTVLVGNLPERPEATGDGALFPALVIGVGEVGLAVVQRLRQELTERFGPSDVLPHLRLLVLDTDPEVARAASRGGSGSLSPGEVLLAPLNRPAHYLKPRDGRLQFESWLNPRMLYRIPRTQLTGGVRALGRLAFCEHHRSIARRLQLELDALLDRDALIESERHTGLGIRSHRPRVYVVASLAGGTGSGMFLDLAYTLRQLIRQAGIEQPDVTGLLVMPRVDRQRPRTMALGNAHAALTELCHYAAPGACFNARYHDREDPIQDDGPPFGRTILLPLSGETDETAVSETAHLAGQFLALELCSSLGRAAELGRASLSGPPESRGLFYQTFALFHLSWPRRALVNQAARQLCAHLVQHWMNKDSTPIRDEVLAWVRDQWNQEELGADALISRLQMDMVKVLGKPAESVFSGVLAPLVQKYGPSSGNAPRRSPASEIPTEELIDVLNQFFELFGRPMEDANSPPGSLGTQLREAAASLAQRWGQKLVEIPVRLIEEPAFRLAGAEQAIRQIITVIEKILDHYEPLTKELNTRAAEAFGRLQALIIPPKPGGSVRRTILPPADVLELLRSYAKWRYQGMVMQQVSGAFVSMRGHLSDELREVNFCRVRLTELQRLLEQSPANFAPSRNSPLTTTGRSLFPAGCSDLTEAVDQLLEQIGSDELADLDAQIQATITQHFTALVNICLSSTNQLKTVEATMLRTAEAFVAARLPQTDVAEMFLERHEEDHAIAEMTGFYYEAAPELYPAGAAEVCVLATPPGEAGDRFRELSRTALPDVTIHPAANDEDVILYRELTNLPLAELEQLGAAGQDAYQQMASAENFTPHSRMDIEFVVQRTTAGP
jgi:hypothetical protein